MFRRRGDNPLGGDRLLQWSSTGAALIAALMLILIAVFLIGEAGPAIRAGAPAAILPGPGWYPTSAEFGLYPMLLATLLVSGLALAIAAPFGLAAALFQLHYAPRWLGLPFRRLLELLAGIPSVVFGLWGLTRIVPLIAHVAPPGVSLLAAAMVLAAMILPTVALLAGAAIAAVPDELWRAGRALGLGRFRLLATVILPAARSGIVTALVLALARALGETMAVVMVVGNVVQVPSSLLDPVRTLTANIALEMAYATGLHRSYLFFSGLLVLGLTLALVLMAERLQLHRARS